MRIAFLIQQLSAGGAQKILAWLAGRAARDGHEARIIAVVKKQVFIPVPEGVTVDTLREEGKPSFPAEALALRRKLRAWKPDVICAFMPYQTKLAVCAAFGLGIPVLASERDDPYRLKKLAWLSNAFFYGCCRRLVFQTELARDCFPPRVRRKSAVIPNPYLAAGEAPEPWTGPRTNRVVSAGRLERIKGFGLLIEAFARLHADFPELTLHIYGEGHRRAEYERQIADAGAAGWIVLEGVQRDVLTRERDARLFVLASLHEGIPNVILEAMAAGVPVVAADCMPGGPRLLLSDGRGGLLCPAGDAAALEQALREALGDPEAAERRAAFARESLRRFDEDTVWRQWAAVLEGMKGTKGQ